MGKIFVQQFAQFLATPNFVFTNGDEFHWIEAVHMIEDFEI
jgi:hypothetical protein